MEANESKPEFLPLHNVGVMGFLQLNAILTEIREELERSNREGIIHTSDVLITVSNTRGQRVLSAAKIDHDLWHVRTVKGLLIMESVREGEPAGYVA